MSIAVLVQVYDETRRLAIAGSTVAPGDFRLKKLIPPLEQAGQKAPVFGKVAQAVQAVVESDEKGASIALLELTTLVNAILYTQGETGAAGEIKPLETTNLGGEATQASARVLKPLLEALNSTGSGRLELIRDAIERGAFRDMRLVKPALFAIDDPYAEIGDLIAQQVLPIYGKAILPELRAKFDLKERTSGHQHRLRLMHTLDPQGSRELVQKVLSEGSKEMKVVAVECLGTTDDDLTYLLEQAKAKAKDVRAAALRALTASGATAGTVLSALKNAISGVDLELIITRVRESVRPEIRDYVLEQAEQQYAETLKCKDAKLQGPAIMRLRHLVACLKGRTDAKAEAFLLKCFENAKAFAAIKSEPSGTDLNELVSQVMATGTPAMQRKLVGAQATLTGGMLSSAILAARQIMTPAEFYTEFSLVLTAAAGKRGRKANDRGTLLAEILTYGGNRYFYRHWMADDFEEGREAKEFRELDPRWLDAAIESGDEDLVYHLARPGHAGVVRFLTEQLAHRKKVHDSTELLGTMVRIGHPDAVDVLIADLKQLAKSSYYYVGYWYGRMITELPKSAVAKLEEVLPTLPDKMVDQLMESVLALKNRPE